MATSFDVPESLFLNKISDRSLLSMDTTDLETFLDGLLISSFTWFRKCKNSLAYDDSAREITADLIDDENEILSSIMVQQWLKPKLFNLDLLRMNMSTRDYNEFSQANHIDKFKALYEESRIEYKQMIRAYVDENTDLDDLYS